MTSLCFHGSKSISSTSLILFHISPLISNSTLQTVLSTVQNNILHDL
jgi:hypothetical protein